MMTADAFRHIALSLRDTAEVGHMAHPDFRRDGRVFATLGYPDDEWGMVKLSPEEQAVLIAAEPTIFKPANGAWGRRGSTLVRLSSAREDVVIQALELAWESVVPKTRAAAPRKKRATR
jgi:hypothetical protein